jgi:hypothetical protein
MVDMGMLLGTVRRLGIAGPPYEVIGFAEPLADGAPQMRIHLIESDEDVDYAVSAILNDPTED